MDALPDGRLFGGSFLIVVVVASIAVYLFSSGAAAYAVATGGMLGFINVVAGFYTLKRFFHASQPLFFQAVFGMMLIRMVLTLAAMGLILILTNIREIEFTVSLVISYILHSVIEVIVIYKNLDHTAGNS